ncbi:MAG: hypothetical protein LBD68_09555, partial [Zoogloeaceae bacterium]|nr:hypothetical protein [Zoogloeaceae bacterium]
MRARAYSAASPSARSSNTEKKATTTPTTASPTPPARGDGKADYTGGGLLARLVFNETETGHWQAEASARLGRVKLDFSARDL